MWVALFALLYAPGPLLLLLVGLRAVGQGIRQRRYNAEFWAGVAATVAALTGRHWIRLLRPISHDEPKPLTPTRRGTAIGKGGVRLEWEQFGPDDAPALLLSHGWSLTHDTWYYQKRALAGEFRVIVWDMRGMGRSGEPPDGDYSMGSVADDLAVIFDVTDAGRHPQGCILAGHSVGAMILPLFATRHPDQMRVVRGLALLGGTDTPLLTSMWGREWLVPLRPYFFQPVAQLLSKYPKVFAPAARLLWQLGAVHLALMYGLHVGHESRGMDDLAAYRCGHVNIRAAGRGALSCFDFDARNAMMAITVPTLLLTGAADINMPPDIQHAMASRLRDPELVLIPDCGHLNLLECHDEVNAQLRRFAQRCLTK